MTSKIAKEGACLDVVWAVDGRGLFPAESQFDELQTSQRARLMALFKKLADHGEIKNITQFRHLDDEIWEVKTSDQIRALGAHRDGTFFVVAVIAKKRGRKIDPGYIVQAKNILAHHDARGQK